LPLICLHQHRTTSENIFKSGVTNGQAKCAIPTCNAMPIRFNHESQRWPQFHARRHHNASLEVLPTGWL
jgi:hypothetical protein